MNHDRIEVAIKSLKDSDHFKGFLEYVKIMREDALKKMQTPEVIANTNLHFTTTGTVLAFDLLLDQIEAIQSTPAR